MNVNFSRDYGTFNFSIDENNIEQDLLNCSRIEKLMATEEFQIMLGVFLQMKERYDESVMKVKPQEQSFRENAIYSSRMNGFWEAVKAPTKIVKAFHDYRNERIKELDEQIKASVNGNGDFDHDE